jgi:hypothetical protein
MKTKLLSSALGAALLATPAPAQTQNSSETVGPPVLRDFQLPGERTVVPPPPLPPRAAPTPAPVPTSAPPNVRPSAPRAPAPTPRVEPQAAPGTSPIVVPEVTQEAQPLPAQPRPSEAPVVEPPAVETTSPGASGESFPWFYGAGGVLAGIALLAWLALRRRKPKSRSSRVSNLAAAEPQAAPPQPVQAIRPWIELEFRPAKAAATDQAASVDYELVVRNAGDAVARNLRAEARMFNAGKQIDSEIRAFFGAPEAKNAALYPLPLAPGEEARVQGQVAIQKQEVREVVIEGRRLFVPMVAFNVTYEWGDGETGQTSMSYLVGRETDPPAEKMAAFRLDLGPRIYRSIGFRPSRIALTV